MVYLMRPMHPVLLYNEDLFAQAGVEVPLRPGVNSRMWWIQLQEAGITPFELTFADSWTCLPPWNSMAPVIPAENFTDERKEGKTAFTGTIRGGSGKISVAFGLCAG